MKIGKLFALAAVLAMGASSWAGDCCGCQCPMGKVAYKLRAPAVRSAAKVVLAQQGKVLVKNLILV